MSFIDEVIKNVGWKFRAIANMPPELLDVLYPDFDSLLDYCQI